MNSLEQIKGDVKVIIVNDSDWKEKTDLTDMKVYKKISKQNVLLSEIRTMSDDKFVLGSEVFDYYNGVLVVCFKPKSIDHKITIILKHINQTEYYWGDKFNACKDYNRIEVLSKDNKKEMINVIFKNKSNEKKLLKGIIKNNISIPISLWKGGIKQNDSFISTRTFVPTNMEDNFDGQSLKAIKEDISKHGSVNKEKALGKGWTIELNNDSIKYYKKH